MRALEQIYKKYRLDVYRYLLSLTHDEDTAEDLLSDCCVIALCKLPFFRGDSSIKTWLFGIARNCYLRYIKRLRKTAALQDLVEVYIEEDITSHLLSKQAAERARELIMQKDERTQAIMNMRIEGYAYKEIAARLGMSEGAARVIEHRAKNQLRAQLKKEGYEIE